MAASYNYCLLDGLAKQGAAVTYACAKYAHEDIPIPPGVDGLRCFFVIASFVQRFSSSRLLRRILRAAEYPLDILVLIGYILIKRIHTVHWMWSLSPSIDVYLFRVLQWCGCRVIYTAHNAFPHERKPHHERTYSRLYQAANHLIVLTQNTAKEIQEVCGITNEKMSVIPHGDFGALHAAYPRDEQLLEDIRRTAGGRKIIAFLGIIRPYKGLDYFIQSFPLIKQQMPDVLFLIAGSVGLGDEELIRKSIAEHSEEDDVWVDIRYLPLAALKAYVEAMDLLVMPYLSASQSGNTVMAYAAGVPVIATDVGGLGEMTTDGETGFVIPPRDSQAIADAVCRCFEGDRYSAMSACARHAAANEFSWSSIARQTIEVYRGNAREPAPVPPASA